LSRRSPAGKIPLDFRAKVDNDRWHALRNQGSESFVSFDALLKRYSVLMLLGLVALAAYFQAAGSMRLLGASIQPTSSPHQTVAAAVHHAVAAAGARNADPILARNAFDSVTGPLNAKNIDLPPTGKKPGPDLSNPLTAPTCEGMRVLIVTESTDPVWSVAALQAPGETAPKMRRVGDTVGDKQVAYIGFNPDKESPTVWMTSGTTLCQATLFSVQPAVTASAKVAVASSAGPAAVGADAARKGPPKVDSDIASKIQKISDTEFRLDRSVVDKILGDQTALMKAARIVPDTQNGQVIGVRLYGIRPDTLLGTLGIQNGDRLETINGFSMGSPEKALEAYARLRSAPGLKVQVNRRGQPVTIDYKIQ
jgi:general secretion pathway protein C